MAPFENPTPLPSNVAPPSVADNSGTGAMSTMYALADHTHASKVRKTRVQSAADGTIVWTYSTPFPAGVVPRISAVAEVPAGTTDVVNVQVIGTPTNTQCTLLVNRTNRTAVSLLGLTILSVPNQAGVTWVHAIAIEP